MLWARRVATLAGLFALLGCGSTDEDPPRSAGGAGGSAGDGGSAGSGGSGGSTGGMGGAGAADPGLVAVFAESGSTASLAGDTFFDHPWPSDARLTPEGTVRFAGYPNHPLGLKIIEDFVGALDGVLHGFSPVASGFLRFDGPLDPASLPSTPPHSLDPASSVQLIDVDPASPEHLQRKLVRLHWQRDEGVYWRANTLAFMPAFGYPLRGGTKYALVVTDAARGEDGAALVQSAAVADELNAPVFSAGIDGVEQAGIPRANIVHFTVFTTNDPVGEATKIRDWVRSDYAAPTASAWTAEEQAASFDAYEGSYGPSPDFQQGTVPFVTFGEGALVFDSGGTPVVQREFDARFVLTVPHATACPMPPGGYPIVLYAHGTGGDYRSYVRDGTAAALAGECLAGMGVDQIFHGTRPGANAGNQEVLFFNVDNPFAARANGPQSAIDVVQQARLFTESATVVPAAVSRTGADVRFDATKVLFFGHSQGGLNGPLFLAVDDQARGGVLSGSGSVISITLLEKTSPVNIQTLVRSLLGLLRPDEAAELNELHPEISLVQSIVDLTDPIHYVRFIASDPRAGFAPKSVLMTEGVRPDFTGDTFTPPHAIEVQAVALGLPTQEPVIHPVEEAAWGGLAPVMVPAAGLAGNLASGRASGVLAQWAPAAGRDGHFVVFDVPAARAQAASFLRELADDPIGRVPAP